MFATTIILNISVLSYVLSNINYMYIVVYHPVNISLFSLNKINFPINCNILTLALALTYKFLKYFYGCSGQDPVRGIWIFRSPKPKLT